MKFIFFLTTIICSIVAARSIRLKTEYHGKGEKLKEFPFAVSIRQYDDLSGFSRHFCGGFVYSSKWIVTAASCVEGKSANTLEVVVGQLKMTNEQQRNEQAIGVSRVFFYDDNSDGFYKYVAKASRILELLNVNIPQTNVKIPNDVALLQLSNDIKFHDDGNSTTTLDPSELKVDYYVGMGSDVPYTSRGAAAGWGKYIRNELDSPNVYMLLYFPVDITEPLVCDGYRLFDRTTMICAIPTSVAAVGSPCYIDKGYPLVQEDSNGHLKVVGIMSHQSCSLDSPSVFTRLGPLYPWFKRTAGYRAGIKSHIFNKPV